MKFAFYLLAMWVLLMCIACQKDEDDPVIDPPKPTPMLDKAAIGTWNRKSDFPGEKRSNALSFVINGKGYMLGGNNGAGWLSDLYEYDPGADTWTKKSSFPLTKRQLFVVMVVNGKAYTGMGLNEGDPIVTKDWFEYDPITDKWTKKATPSFFNGRAGGIAFGAGSKGYFGGGYGNLPNFPEPLLLKNFYEYDPASDTWTEKASIPENTTAAQPSVVVNGKGYLIAGSTYLYNSEKNEWSPAGVNAATDKTTFSIGKFLYFGLTDNAKLRTIDTELKVIGDNTDLPSSATPRTGGFVFVIGKKAFFGLGKSASSSQMLGDLLEFSIP